MPDEHALAGIVGRRLGKFTGTGDVAAADVKPITGEPPFWNSVHAVAPSDPYKPRIRERRGKTVHPFGRDTITLVLCPTTNRSARRYSRPCRVPTSSPVPFRGNTRACIAPNLTPSALKQSSVACRRFNTRLPGTARGNGGRDVADRPPAANCDAISPSNQRYPPPVQCGGGRPSAEGPPLPQQRSHNCRKGRPAILKGLKLI
jgi:hypothetical protein